MPSRLPLPSSPVAPKITPGAVEIPKDVVGLGESFEVDARLFDHVQLPHGEYIVNVLVSGITYLRPLYSNFWQCRHNETTTMSAGSTPIFSA